MRWRHAILLLAGVSSTGLFPCRGKPVLDILAYYTPRFYDEILT